MKMTHIEIPRNFQRNAQKILELGVEETGSTLIQYTSDLLGYADLSEKDVLDIGCGVRFTQTIINRQIPIKSYTGIEINKALVTYLKNNVIDSRFSFYYWNIYNEAYNKDGKPLTPETRLPLQPPGQKFDTIWMFSVITHNNPEDTEAMFYVMRKYIKKNGYLFFSAFLDNNIESYEDRIKDQPLLQAYYNEHFLRQILSKTGWQVKSVHGKRADNFIQDHFVCQPI